MTSTLSSLIIDQYTISVCHFYLGNWYHFFLHLSHCMLRLRPCKWVIILETSYLPNYLLNHVSSLCCTYGIPGHSTPLTPYSSLMTPWSSTGEKACKCSKTRDMKYVTRLIWCPSCPALPCPALPCPALPCPAVIYWDLLEYVCCAILSLCLCFSKVMLRVLFVYGISTCIWQIISLFVLLFRSNMISMIISVLSYLCICVC